MTPKRAEQIRHEIVSSGGWTSSATDEEDKEIMEYWKTLGDYSCYHEAVCKMARGEHIDPDLPEFLGGPER